MNKPSPPNLQYVFYSKPFRTAGRVFLYAFLALLAIIILAPFLWLVSSTLRPASELYVYPPLFLPKTFTVQAYPKAFEVFSQPLVNSVIYSFSTGLISLVVACPAAYSLVRYRYPAKRGIVAAMLITQMLPFVLLLLPLYIIFIRLGLYNTRLGLIIAFTALTIPYSVLLLRGYFSTLPLELEEAAMIDGCTRLGAFWRVVLPLSTPALVAVLLSNVVLVWNDVLFVIFLTKDLSVQTASVALYHFFTMRAQSGGMGQKEIMLAGGVLLTMPILLVFPFLQKYIAQGLTLGALKG